MIYVRKEKNISKVLSQRNLLFVYTIQEVQMTIKQENGKSKDRFGYKSRHYVKLNKYNEYFRIRN